MKKPDKIKTAFEEYDVRDCIGEGGNGIVYSSIASSGDNVAVKFLDSAKATKEKMKRFENEYRFCMGRHHSNIINVLDYGLTESNDPFFVMPKYDYSLRKIIGKLSAKDSFSIYTKILDGVDAAHRLNVIHRDVKPENILLAKNNSDVVLADFGIAHFGEDELYTAVMTKDGARLANFQYAAPEQREKGKNVREQADIYALGLILNELFTGKLALGTDFQTISAVAPEYGYLDQVVQRMLCQEPAKRFQTIDELKKELEIRGAENISRLKLSSLKGTVISNKQPDDPIINDPMKIVNVDWRDSVLTIMLNNKINSNWIWAIQNINGRTALWGKGPENFEYSGNSARIPASRDEVQNIIDYFKQWIPSANQNYIAKLSQEQEKKERKEREELQRKIQAEEERMNLLQTLKF